MTVNRLIQKLQTLAECGYGEMDVILNYEKNELGNGRVATTVEQRRLLRTADGNHCDEELTECYQFDIPFAVVDVINISV